MRIMIDGKQFTNQMMNEWKLKRVNRAYHHLKVKVDKSKDLDELESQLIEIKMKLTNDEINKLLNWKLFLTDILMNLASLISGKNRRSSIITIIEPNLDAELFSSELDKLMLIDTISNQKINLSACPEHYVLKPQRGILEVIETPGNSPLPTRFYITFDDQTGINEERDCSYPYQSVGVARLKRGTVIGGVRHQFKNTSEGLEARLCVEFPSICPQWFIKEHQKHLGVEWTYWINWIKKNKTTAS